ncbi:hypothetical protein GCM10011409_15590 [Lentibacillus populi]|uniref:Hydroxyacid dehydrogenase n=1 Tax=Lentibacillus populi TaxID=1827502 RepID=A0A9W5X522_9BACI|nr:hydroxyacid dehydrogenase [Lentibacillus populi]GGB38946.1 hypothetical protein GCM10011409_15590 [Lentibacillus populi]
MHFKVLIPQQIDSEGVKLLQKAGATIIDPPSYDEETLLTYVQDVDAILARTERYSQKVLENAYRLKIIARHGIGVDNIDVKAANERGILITNAPTANINAVAELVLGFMLSGMRNLLNADKAVRCGDFEIRNRLFGYELRGKTLGIIGFGNIGRLIADKSNDGLGMNILIYDPYISRENVPSNMEVTNKLENLLSHSDVVTLHVPYSRDTHHLINRKSIKLMKKDALLINASRGGVVDEDALADVLRKNEIRGACIDVFENEPPVMEHPLFQLDNVIVTPHLGALTFEAFKEMALTTAGDIIAVMKGETPVYPIVIK